MMRGIIEHGGANAADRRLDAGFGEAFGIFYRHVLRSAIAVMNQATAMNWPPIMQCLLQRVEDDPKGGEANLAWAVRLTRQPTI